MERRNKRVACNLEDIVFEILTQQVVGKQDTSISDYVRSLIINDLDKRNLLPTIAKDVLLTGIESVDLEGVA